MVENNILEFSPSVVKIIRKKYNLDNGRLEHSIELLEEWINKQAHFVRKDFDREFLERLLIARKGSVEKTKVQLDNLCTLKTIVPMLFGGGQVRKTFEIIFDDGCLAILPKLTKDHIRIVVGKVDVPCSKPETINLIFTYFSVAADYLRYYDYNDGFIFIQDLRRMNLMDSFKNLNITVFQQIIQVLIKGYGARVKGMFLITQSKVIDRLLTILKPLLNPKLASRIFVIENEEGLYAHIEKDLLPVEYGGKEKPLRELSDKLFDTICSEKFETYLAKCKEMCTNESLRQVEKFNEDFMGLPGTFRTLSVD